MGALLLVLTIVLPATRRGAYQRMFPLNFSFSAFQSTCLRRAHFLSYECPAGGGKERGLRAGRPKVGGKTAGETPDPRCLSNRTPAGIFCAATEIPLACWPLVTGAAGILLRLTALGMRIVSCYAKLDASAPSTGRQPKLDKIPATDQMPKDLVQWQLGIVPDGVQLGKSGGRGGPGGVLVTFSPRKK